MRGLQHPPEVRHHASSRATSHYSQCNRNAAPAHAEHPASARNGDPPPFGGKAGGRASGRAGASIGPLLEEDAATQRALISVNRLDIGSFRPSTIRSNDGVVRLPVPITQRSSAARFRPLRVLGPTRKWKAPSIQKALIGMRWGAPSDRTVASQWFWPGAGCCRRSSATSQDVVSVWPSTIGDWDAGAWGRSSSGRSSKSSVCRSHHLLVGGVTPFCVRPTNFR